MIEVDELHVHAGKTPLLSGVSLRVAPGQLTVLLGPNGAGKSTLLGAICGHVRPLSGAIRLDGRALADWPAAACARIRAALLQDVHMVFDFTAFDVVLLGRTPHVARAETERDRAIALAAMRTTQTEHLALRTYMTLSGGERQRVQIARILAQIWEAPAVGHRCLLLDEPTSHLDLVHQHTVLEAARRFARAGTSVLIILHDLNLAAQYADAVIVLSAGRIISAGPPAAVLTAQTLDTAFGISAHVFTDTVLGRPIIVTTPAVH